MTSTVDSVINALEMDSCPDPPRTDNARIAGGFSAADSFPNRARSDNTRIAGTAGFAMGYPTVLQNKDSPFYSLFDARPIPPPPTMPHFWQYPEYRTFASRYATFKNWPKYLKGPSKTDMARAGFIYTQYGDRVTCFCCGMTLSEREPVDDAYREHLRWSKSCHFAQMVGSM
ncbi:E3 ubiquitin-protein ligase XIAP-like [Crassostrea angulata]|uniref:E3 ubiquitin-protein ligase XIAP-like n=1 Tax=Magallana angulata TaxID=2784310 RepID=UPI0022B140A4|nr:E3 ubiquitin-protein ligase XIAP-like [Crassostrea angulata]